MDRTEERIEFTTEESVEFTDCHFERTAEARNDAVHGLTLEDVDFLRYVRGFLTDRTAIARCADLTRRIEALFPAEHHRYPKPSRT
jgi:hypothetical protein